MTDQTASDATIRWREPDTERAPLPHDLRDFTATPRMLVIATLAAFIGAAGADPVLTPDGCLKAIPRSPAATSRWNG